MCLKSFTLWCLRGILLWTVSMVPGESFAQSEDLTLELSMVEFEPTAGKIIVLLDAFHSGTQPLMIPSLRKELLERYAFWGGWIISTTACSPQEEFFYSLRRGLDPEEKDLMTLSPGEHVSFTMNLATMRIFSGKPRKQYRKEVPVTLGLVEGDYKVQLGVCTPQRTIPEDLKKKLWQGCTTSNMLEFMITHKKPRMYFSSNPSMLHSPDGQYSVTNAPFSSKDEKGLYLHDLQTGHQEHIYSYPHQVEVLWSPESTRILMNDYSCGEGDDYHTYPLIFLVKQKIVRNIREELQRHLGDKLGNDANIMGTEWRTEDTLLIRNLNYGLEQGPSYFIDDNNQIVPNPEFDRNYIQWYEYDVPSRSFTRVE